ncbi:cation diffusion facilitator 10 protein [Rutstroemia sp. NJR-2017a BBW]|nr:cation diffusion facilitator 10 protein [Rutstroemia sp. NJR-2017a BBW]
MANESYSSSSSPPKARMGRMGLSGWLPLSTESTSPMATHGQGALTRLIKNQSNASLVTLRRPSASLRGRELLDEEEQVSLGDDRDDNARSEERRLSAVLNGPQMRSQRLIGNSNPRYKGGTEEDKKKVNASVTQVSQREYYERNNSLIQQYLYVDRLLDSSLPHDLLNEYDHTSSSPRLDVPATITEEPTTPAESGTPTSKASGNGTVPKRVKRTPRDIYKVTENTPLLSPEEEDEYDGPRPEIPGVEDDSVESGDRIVQIAIYVNLAANTILLAGKIAVIVLTSSLSVLASLVDAALDFLSTAIVFATTRMIERQDQDKYPVGRRRLEPIGVLVLTVMFHVLFSAEIKGQCFSVIMVTSFFQVALECFNRLISDDHTIIELGLPAIAIMSSTVLIKALCWLWCRLIKNSSVQALAQDAMTDVIFNIFSIIFPLVGFYAKLWWLDALGGLLLSVFVIVNWAGTSAGHIRNLTGATATPDERNVLLYLTMRFAKTIKQIQGLQAYHAGDKLNVEVDIVLDENMNLRDSHDLGESLQYVLESVPTVDRAFVHQDYASWNLPTHMQQQGE